MPRNPNCTMCSLHHFANTRCVWGHGSTDAPIMLLGEAPGANEDKQGLPFIGEAGKVLDRALGEAGLTRGDCYITNAAKCRPPDNRTPTTQEIDICLQYLLEEIETVQPRVIVCMGGSALKALTGLNAVAQARGRQLTPRKRLILSADTTIMATYHPAAVLYDRKNYQYLVQDFKLVKQIVYPSDNKEHRISILYPGQTDDGFTPAEELFNSIRSATVIACDLEWTAASKDSMTWPWSNMGELLSISLSARTAPDTVVSISLGWPPDNHVLAQLSDLLKASRIIFHNTVADVTWLDSVAIKANASADTMILSYLLDETSDNKLETVATHYASDLMGGWKGHIRSTRPVLDVEWDDLLTYNANDTYATLLAFEGIQKRLNELDSDRKTKIVRLHNKLLLPAALVLARSAIVGFPIDEEMLRKERDSAHQRLMDAGTEFANITGMTLPDALKLAGSTEQTKAYLSGSLGIELQTSRRDVLSNIVEKYPTVHSILAIRKETKMLSTYLDPWLVMADRQKDQRLHTVYRITGTRTGRLSAESELGGSLQVTPRERWVRQLIRARDGYMIISADYSTVELRIIAWRAPEPTMTRLFRDGVDIHRATAAFIKAQQHGNVNLTEFMDHIGEHISTVTKDERQAAKGVNFGLAFGMQADKLQLYARTNYGVHMTWEQAQDAHHNYFKFYSHLYEWQQREMRDAQRLGYTETVWGRRRHFDSNDVHAAVNTPIQSTASDFGLLAMIRVVGAYRDAGIDAEVIGFVHDSILVEAREDQSEMAAQVLRHTMENPDTTAWGFECPIPLPAEAKIGRTWDG